MNHSVKKLVTGAALVLAAFSAVAADPIKIGSVLSVTGPAAFLGDPELKTLQLYVVGPAKFIAPRPGGNFD